MSNVYVVDSGSDDDDGASTGQPSYEPPRTFQQPLSPRAIQSLPATRARWQAGNEDTNSPLKHSRM